VYVFPDPVYKREISTNAPHTHTHQHIHITKERAQKQDFITESTTTMQDDIHVVKT
jgi:hypothetical protein